MEQDSDLHTQDYKTVSGGETMITVIPVIESAIRLDSLFLIFLTSTMLTGSVVTIGSRWGRIRGNNEFQSYWRIIAFFVIEGLLITTSIEVLGPYMYDHMFSNLIWLPAVNCSIFSIFTAWFSRAFEFRVRWRVIGVLNLPLAITLIVFYIMRP